METEGLRKHPNHFRRLASPRFGDRLTIQSDSKNRENCLHYLTVLHSTLQNLLIESLIDGAEADNTINERFPLYPKATNGELATFKRKCQEQLGVRLPRHYLDLLALTDGIDHGSLLLFGAASECSWAPGLLEQNLNNLHLNQRRLLALGLSNEELLVWDHSQHSFQMRVLNTGDIIRSHPTFWSMLAYCLARELDETYVPGGRCVTCTTGNGNRRRKSSSNRIST